MSVSGAECYLVDQVSPEAGDMVMATTPGIMAPIKAMADSITTHRVSMIGFLQAGGRECSHATRRTCLPNTDRQTHGDKQLNDQRRLHQPKGLSQRRDS